MFFIEFKLIVSFKFHLDLSTPISHPALADEDVRFEKHLCYLCPPAEVVKLVDTLCSGRSSRKGVRVRVSPSARFDGVYYRDNYLFN